MPNKRRKRKPVRRAWTSFPFLVTYAGHERARFAIRMDAELFERAIQAADREPPSLWQRIVGWFK
jgi:hypothetical protein